MQSQAVKERKLDGTTLPGWKNYTSHSHVSVGRERQAKADGGSKGGKQEQKQHTICACQCSALARGSLDGSVGVLNCMQKEDS